MRKHRALLVPVICPFDRYISDPAGIDYSTVYWEIRRRLRHRLKFGSFAVLYDEGYEGHSLVFLNPYEVFLALDAKIVSMSRNKLKIINKKHISRMHWEELNSFLSSLWNSGDLFIVSRYIAEATIDDLTIHCKQYNLTCYCYGRISRLINRMDIDTVTKTSRLVAIPSKVSEPLEKANMIINILRRYPTRWPWMNLGLAIDKSRKWISALTPEACIYIETDNILEVRIMNYVRPGWLGNYIPIIIIRKFTLTSPSIARYITRYDGMDRKHGSPRLSDVLEKAIIYSELNSMRWERNKYESKYKSPI